jgi:hypothetical protein
MFLFNVRRRPALRPRGLVLTALVAAVAWILWHNASGQRAASSQAVGEWVRSAARAAQADRGSDPPMGATEPVVSGSFASWVRGAVPADSAGEARVTVEPVGDGPFGGGGGEATHRVRVEMRGEHAEADVRWSPDAPAMTGFRRGERAPAPR